MSANLAERVSVNAPFTVMRYDSEIAIGPGYSMSEVYEQPASNWASNRDCPNA